MDHRHRVRGSLCVSAPGSVPRGRSFCIMTDSFLKQLSAQLAAGDTHTFYNSPEWRTLRAQVLKLDHYECVLHKWRGKYRKAEIVHHVRHLKEEPALALSVYGPDGGRQLISVCRWCHENVCHPDRVQRFPSGDTGGDGFTTAERWD